ncbi:hypothetical protein GCM10022276_23110 [Sphingomonas limnosediminicola]|uniref:Uncharacterized protein n=1 Tax=Sphingomonas limnosediminicola TaxID=940133 RepID=A0ABP7LMK2_9SPHN
MQIHAPKPLHGWREFFGEVGIIVLGVLIALVAQEIVKVIANREQVVRGEDSLRDNFARFVMFAAELDAYAPCVAARATEVRQIIDQAAAARRLPRVGPIPQLAPHPWQTDTYGAMVASQAITHVSHDRAILYSRISMSAADLYQDAMIEWAEWGALASLSGGPRRFSEAEEAEDRLTLARAVHQDALMRIIADTTLARIKSTGLLDKRAFDLAAAKGGEAARAIPMCRPINVARQA